MNMLIESAEVISDTVAELFNKLSSGEVPHEWK